MENIPYMNITSIENIKIIGTNNRMTYEEANDKLHNYCSESNFNDDTWFIDKNLQGHRKSIYFSQINNESLKNEIKLWIIYRLIKRRSISTLTDDVTHVSKFANLIDNNAKSFTDATPYDVLKLYNLLFNESKHMSLRGQLRDWYGVKTFVTEMKFIEIKHCMSKYIVEEYPQNSKDDAKYIPEEIVTKLDILFMKKECIPLSFKCIYWTLRLIPNRVTEALSLTINCLKQIDNNTYVLTIPTFKQSGSYYKGTVKMIEIKNEGIGAYYINLLQQQIEYTNNLDIEDKSGFLFYSPAYFMNNKNNELTFRKCKPPKILSYGQVRRFFKRLCLLKEFTDDAGNIISLNTHQFRHNCITDRLVSGIFRPIDIMGLTAHHNTKMIEDSYTHRDSKDLTIEQKPIIFNGRIINTDNDIKINAILKKPFAKRIYKLGICSDIRDCHNDKSKCLRCEYLIPNTDDLDYYQNEINDWKSKKEKSELIGNNDFSELCSYWIESYEILIKRIISSISNENIQFDKNNNIRGDKDDE